MKMTQDAFLAEIAKALGVEKQRVTMESSQETVEEWDSLGHLSILQSLDKTTNGGVDQVAGIGGMTSVREIWASMVSAGLVGED